MKSALLRGIIKNKEDALVTLFIIPVLLLKLIVQTKSAVKVLCPKHHVIENLD